MGSGPSDRQSGSPEIPARSVFGKRPDGWVEREQVTHNPVFQALRHARLLLRDFPSGAELRGAVNIIFRYQDDQTLKLEYVGARFRPANRMIMRATKRFGIIMWLLLLLPFHVSAQSTQPTLKGTMTFIANTLNSRGSVSWTTHIDDMWGAKFMTTNSLALVKADPSTCSLAWTNIEIDSHHKTVDAYLVQLQVVSAVNLQPYSRNLASQSEWEHRVSPETYLVQITTNTAIRGQRELYKKIT